MLESADLIFQNFKSPEIFEKTIHDKEIDLPAYGHHAKSKIDSDRT